MQERIVHLIRHAEAFHNAEGSISLHRFFLGGEWRRFSSLARVWRSIWRLIRSLVQGKNKQQSSAVNNEHLDAVLTPTGLQQVAELRKHCREAGIAQGVQLVVVSPMTRALQTAVGVFRYNKEAASVPLLTDKVIERPYAISSLESPLVAVELCRERVSVRPSDKRNPISNYKMKFPQVDFSQVESDEDAWWNPEIAESQEQLHARIKAFLQWLLAREEQEIAVISHSRFLREMMGCFGENQSPFIYFPNGKLRTVRILQSLGNFRILDT